MRNRIVIAAMYTEAYIRRVDRAAVNTKNQMVEHKSEMITAAVTTVVVGTVAHVVGFRAGYEFANAA